MKCSYKRAEVCIYITQAIVLMETVVKIYSPNGSRHSRLPTITTCDKCDVLLIIFMDDLYTNSYGIAFQFMRCSRSLRGRNCRDVDVVNASWWRLAWRARVSERKRGDDDGRFSCHHLITRNNCVISRPQPPQPARRVAFISPWNSDDIISWARRGGRHATRRTKPNSLVAVRRPQMDTIFRHLCARFISRDCNA